MVHLLQLLLCGRKGVWWRIQLVGLEAFIGKPDLERLVIFLLFISYYVRCKSDG